MTSLSSWRPRAGGDAQSELHACLQCDVCRPPTIEVGTRETMTAEGWRFDDLEHGEHVCRACVTGVSRPPRTLEGTKGHQPALPNLVVIGAPKSGTTSLHSYLALHPEVQMADEKELRFFQDPDCLDKLAEYAQFFDGRFPVRGETSPVYADAHLVSGVAVRMRAALPDARLIYLVRDPVERAISAFSQPRGRAELDLTADQAFADMDDPYNRFLTGSRYATQAEPFLRLFGRDALLVLEQRDLLERREQTMRRVFGFLGVDEAFTSPGFAERANTSADKRQMSRAGVRLRESRANLALARAAPGLRRRIAAPARRLLSGDLAPPEIDDAIRERLRDGLRGEAARFRELVGEPFESWQV